MNFCVISGEPLDRIRAGNTERMVAGIPQSREFRTGQAFAGKYRDRQVGVACGGVRAEVRRRRYGIRRFRELGGRPRATGAIRYNVRKNFFTYDRTLHRDGFNALTRTGSAWTTARRRGRYSQ